MNLFAKNIKYLLEQSGHSHAKVAAGLGIGRTTITGYSTGDSEPNIKGLFRIAEYFDVEASDLLSVDLSNVHLIDKKQNAKKANNVHLNVHPNVHLMDEKKLSALRKECDLKAVQIAEKQHLIDVQKKLIESLEATIKTLRKGSPQSTYTARRSTKDGHPAHKRSSNT